MVSSKEILEIESSFCLLIPEQLSLLKVFLFLDINYIGFSTTVMPINVFFFTDQSVWSLFQYLAFRSCQ